MHKDGQDTWVCVVFDALIRSTGGGKRMISKPADGVKYCCSDVQMQLKPTGRSDLGPTCLIGSA